MSYRVLTVSREFGSGGAEIAKTIAYRLGWKLLDSMLIEQIARRAHVDPSIARACDERVDSWIHRLNKSGVIAAVLAAGAPATTGDIFDAEAMASLSAELIERAWTEGDSVIVGRGAQCVLRGRPDVFHVFVYASRENRLERLVMRLPDRSDLAVLMDAFDAERARYIRRFHGEMWDDRHLYHMMVSSDHGEETAVRSILAGMRLG